MKQYWRMILLAAVTATWAAYAEAAPSSEAPVRTEPVVLVKDGQPAATIVLGHKPTKMAILAATELQWHIEQITGAKLPVIRDPVSNAAPEAITGTPIYIGETPRVRELGLKNNNLSDREILVQFVEGAIVLTGREDWSGNIEADQPIELKMDLFDMGNNRGSLFAVYEFIENFLGVRWYAPGESNIAWPEKTTTLAVTPRNIRRTPAIQDRNTAWGMNADAWGKPGPSEGEVNLFKLRNKAAGAPWIHHGVEGWPERFWEPGSSVFEEQHQEYFSKDQGAGQLCYTSEGTVQQAIKDMQRWASGSGTTHRVSAGSDWYSFEPRDTPVRCTCETCAPLLKSKDQDFNSGEASVIVWGFADKVARAVAETHPGKYVAMLAYGNHAGCPEELDLATNIYVGMAVFPRGTPDMEDGDYKKYVQWNNKLPGRMHSVWLYPCFPREGAGIQGYTAFPKLEARGLNAQMKLFSRDKVKCFMFCGAYDHILDYWASVKYQDDPNRDVEADVHEFFTRFYGAAAAPMEKWYTSVEAASVGIRDLSEQNSWELAGTDERMAEWQKLMDEATALASTDLEKKRVAVVRDGLWAEMLKGKSAWTFKSKFQADVDQLKQQPPPDTNVVKLAASPEGDDARNVDWTSVTPVKIFRTIAGFPAPKRTADLSLAHDGKNLYIKLLDHVDVNNTGDSGAPWWGDRWEIFISKQRDTKAGQSLEDRNKGQWGPYRQIGVRPNASKPDMWTSEFDGPHKDDWGHWPNLDIKLKSDKGADGWAFYMTIPLDDVSVAGPVKPGEWVYLNFMGPNGASGETLCLSPTFNPGAYHNIPRMAGFKLDE